MYRLFFFMLMFGELKAQVLIDTMTIRQANTYLVKGAIARQKVGQLYKVVYYDSIIIAEQDSVIMKQKYNIKVCNEQNNALVKRNKAIRRTLVMWKGISIAILIILSWTLIN